MLLDWIDWITNGSGWQFFAAGYVLTLVSLEFYKENFNEF